MLCTDEYEGTSDPVKPKMIHFLYVFFFFPQLCDENMRNLLFGDYMISDVDESEKLYAEVPSIERFGEVVEACLEEYNQTHKNRMNLVIFR